MGVVLASGRFGELDLDPAAIVDFPNGLIGLGGSRYALLARGDDPPILWLQSLDDPDLALPVCDPARFFDDFAVELTPQDAERVGVDPAQTTVYVTVRAGDGEGGFSANLRAPILIAGRVGHQVINQAPEAPVRAVLDLARRRGAKLPA